MTARDDHDDLDRVLEPDPALPGGGGGYLVATKLPGSRLGVISGCALLVDYVLTITVSVASGCDQLWSCSTDAAGCPGKLPAEFVVLAMLVILLNLRGVKESVQHPRARLPPLRRDSRVHRSCYAIVAHAPALPARLLRRGE